MTRLDEYKAYVSEHALESVLSDAMTTVMEQRPSQPVRAMGELLVSRAERGTLLFVRDDHTTPEEQICLAGELHRFAGGDLWLEFFYESQLAKVRAAFATDGAADDAAALAAVQEAVSSNGWSSEFNSSLVALMKIAQRYRVSVHALDSPEWSLDAFKEKHGGFRGKMKYLNNRASQLDDGKGATSRWVQKVLRQRGGSDRPVVVLGGAEHGSVMLEILKKKGLEMSYMFEDFGAVQAAAKKKIEHGLQSAKAEKAPDEADEEEEEKELLGMLSLFGR